MSRGKTETNVSQIFPIPPKLHVKAAKLKQIFPNIPNSVQLHVHAVKRNKSFPISPYSVQYMSQISKISKTETKKYSHPGNFRQNIFNNIAVDISPKLQKYNKLEFYPAHT